MKEAITATEVASRAGVSRSCVYHILAAPNHPRYPQATRERVLRTSRELDYVPHAAARALRSRKTHTIGLIGGADAFRAEQAGGFGADFLPGLCLTASELGYHTLVEMEYRDDPEGTSRLYRTLIRGRRIDGIATNAPTKDAPYLDILRLANIPVVLLGYTCLDMKFDYVDSDNVEVARLATRYLLELGHRRIVHLTGPAHGSAGTSFANRRRGYREAMREAAVEPRELVAFDEVFAPNRPAEQIVAELWSSSSQPPTAIFADDDMLAAGIVGALQNRGLDVPADVSVVGINDSIICNRTRPALSSVRLNVRQLGEEVAKLLIARIENPDQPVRRVIVPCELIVRESSAPPSHPNAEDARTGQ